MGHDLLRRNLPPVVSLWILASAHHLQPRSSPRTESKPSESEARALEVYQGETSVSKDEAIRNIRSLRLCHYLRRLQRGVFIFLLLGKWIN